MTTARGLDIESAISERRVLVTGASGFIGTALCRRLTGLGANVHAVSRAPRSMPGVSWHACDLADPEATAALLAAAKPDVVLHLASHVVGARGAELVMPTFRDNLASTVNLLFAAHTLGCGRVVLTGSLEEPEPGPTWSVPSSPYAAAKLAAGAYGRMFHALYGLDVVTLRVFMVYGPAQRDESKLVPYVIKSLLSGQSLRLTSGVREVDWIYVDDVVEAFVRAAIAKNVAGSTLDVGSGELVTVRGVVERIYEIIQPHETPRFGGANDRAMEQMRRADTTTTFERVGWRPEVSLIEGLQRTVLYHRERMGGTTAR